MLISSARFTKGLDLEARVFAEVTGIALGWLDNKKTYRCACWVCEFIVERSVERSISPRQIEEYVHDLFAREIERFGCLHWNKYVQYKEEPNHEELSVARSSLRRADDRSQRLQQPVEPEPWELEIPEEDLEADAIPELQELECSQANST